MNSAGSILSNLQKKGLVPMLAQTPTSNNVPLKIGLFGDKATGKSTTAALIAAALSAQFSNRAPVYVVDPEVDWQFLRKRIFAVEKIELIISNEKSFKGMMAGLAAAKAAGCCAWIVDPLTPIWTELLTVFHKSSGGNMDYGDWNDLKGMWGEYVDTFLNSKMHCIASGRLRDVQQEVLDERDPSKTKKINVGAEFKAGGGESFGYEPHLLLEMSLERKAKVKAGSRLEGEGRMVHRADVIKDRTWELNGKILRWSDKLKYEPGGYRQVWESIKPHFDFVQSTVTQPQIAQTSSRELIGDNGHSAYYRDKQEREIALEKFDALMGLIYPGQTADEKRKRALVTQEITGTLSRTDLEANVFTPRLKWAAEVMAAYAERIKGGDFPANEEQLKAMVALAKKDVADPSREKETVLEDALKKTMGRVVNGKLLAANGGTK